MYTLVNQSYIEKTPIITDVNSKSVQQPQITQPVLKQIPTPKPIVASNPNECPPFFKCLNGGRCVIDEINGPKCFCAQDFEGLNCAQSKSAS